MGLEPAPEESAFQIKTTVQSGVWIETRRTRNSWIVSVRHRRRAAKIMRIA